MGVNRISSKAGYGRGYYGQEQLAKPPARGGRWVKWALAAGVVGAGAVIWLMWPRKPEQDEGEGAGPEDYPRARALPPGQPALLASQRVQSVPQQMAPCFFPGTEVWGPSHSTEAHELSHGAEARGRHGGEGRGGSSYGAEARGFCHGAEGRCSFHGGEVRGSSYGAEARGFSHGAEARGLSYGAEARGLSHGAEARGLSHGAEARGLSHSTMSQSQRDYEDAVVASARQLQATGTKVVLPPHLAHLASRIGS